MFRLKLLGSICLLALVLWLARAPLATAALFDLGVYVTVVGATMLMLSVLGAACKEPSTVPTPAPDLARSPGAAAAPEGAR